MLLESLKTFLLVAESRSFISAADKLFLSPNAVKKRIDQMESDLGLRLFFRSKKGLTLTAAGESFYRDGEKLLRSLERSIEHARELQKEDDATIRIGCMSTFRDMFLTTPWEKNSVILERYRVRMVFYASGPEEKAAMFDDLGSALDVIVDVYDEELAARRNVCAKKITDDPMRFLFSEKHPLAGKQVLRPEDLEQETLLVLKRGVDQVWDDLVEQLGAHYPKLRFLEVEDYGLQSYNLCLTERRLMLARPNWLNIFPFSASAEPDWEFKLPFGLYYPPESGEKVRGLIDSAMREGV